MASRSFTRREGKKILQDIAGDTIELISKTNYPMLMSEIFRGLHIFPFLPRDKSRVSALFKTLSSLSCVSKS